MPVWEDEPTRDEWRPTPLDDATLTHARPAVAVDQTRVHDEVRAAAQSDAGEIIARARRDIRRIVDDARKEIQELSAQLEAADVHVADSDLPDPSIIEEDESIPTTDAEWLGAPPVTELPSPFVAVAPDYRDEEDSILAATFTPPTAPARSAKTFVALFTLAGIVVLAGTVWWLRQAPATVTSAPPASVASTTSPVSNAPAPPDSSPSAPSATDVPPSLPAPPAAGLSVAIEAQRDTWVRWTVDGESDAGRTYAAGEKRQVDGVDEVAIRAGDAGGLLISVDGAPARAFGPDGVSLTRRFTRATPLSSRPAPPVAATTPPAATLPPATQTPAALPAAPGPLQTPAPAATSPALTPPPPSVPVAAGPTRPPAPAPGPAPAPLVSLPAPSAQVPVRTAAPARVDITATSRQWLDAYHRQDRVTMESLGAPSLTISDERLADQRFPFGLEIARAFEDEQLELSGDSAKFTAKMTERAATGAVVSRVAQTWVRRQGQWQLQEARIVHDSQSPTVPR